MLNGLIKKALIGSKVPSKQAHTIIIRKHNTGRFGSRCFCDPLHNYYY